MVQKWNDIELEIILLLLKKSIHVRSISKELKVPNATLIRKLKVLEKKNIIDYKKIGKNKEYSLKKNIFTRKLIINAENYRLIKLMDKHQLLSPLFEDILKECNCDIIILFGSYAKDNPNEESDIDIYIETNNPSIKKSIELVNSKISVKLGKFDKNSLLIKEIIKSHTIIRGAEKFYEKIGFFD